MPATGIVLLAIESETTSGSGIRPPESVNLGSQATLPARAGAEITMDALQRPVSRLTRDLTGSAVGV
jgi:hypothetical protein